MRTFKFISLPHLFFYRIFSPKNETLWYKIVDRTRLIPNRLPVAVLIQMHFSIISITVKWLERTFIVVGHWMRSNAICDRHLKALWWFNLKKKKKELNKMRRRSRRMRRKRSRRKRIITVQFRNVCHVCHVLLSMLMFQNLCLKNKDEYNHH